MSYRRGSRSHDKQELRKAAYERPPVVDLTCWNEATVCKRLHDAMRSIRTAVRKDSPKEYGCSLPDYVRALERDEAVFFSDDAYESVPPIEMSRALRAIEWPGRYLVGKWPGPNNVLRVWLNAIGVGRSPRKALKEAGYGGITGSDALARAFRIIAEGLLEDDVPFDF